MEGVGFRVYNVVPDEFCRVLGFRLREVEVYGLGVSELLT